MAYRFGQYQPRQDTGWGLIYRLNLLLGKIETDVENGDLDSWSKHIDAVYRNILYKNQEEIVYENKKLVDVNFSQEDIKIFSMFSKKIYELKKKMVDVMSYEEEHEKNVVLVKLREEYYNLLWKKDVWMRKKMFKLDLYLKQVEHDPRRAIYGG